MGLETLRRLCVALLELGTEFACAVPGAKLVLAMGHTACGAIKGPPCLSN